MTQSPASIAIFLPTLYCGGAERSMLKLAGGIASQGYSVDVVLARAEGPFLAEVPSSVRLVNLGAGRLLTSLPALTRYLRKAQPAALLSGLQANIIGLLARRLAAVGTRVAVSERNMLSQNARQFASDLRVRFTPQLARLFYPWADDIIAVSEGVAQDLVRAARIPRERIRVIYNPVVTPELRLKAQAPLEHSWFGSDSPPVILAVGRLTAQKDFPTLIKAFSEVRKSRPARLLILGEGEERPALEALVREHGLEEDVGLPGFISNPYPLMAHARLFVLSSRWEGLPGALIEALYCGVSLIATDCESGPREILADGRYGRLVPVSDPGALAQAIEDGLDGQIPRPPQESWMPFELNFVVHQYVDLLFSSGPSRVRLS